MHKILITDSLSDEGIEILREEKSFEVNVGTKLSPDELKKTIEDAEAIIIRSGTKLTKDIIQAAHKLKIIGRAGVGLDNVDVEEASKYGIIVMNTPGGNTIATAEHTMSLMLALSRNISQANRSVKEGKWERKKFMGSELYGKTLGIIGLGRIGTEVAKRAIAFGMKIISYDPYLSTEKANQIGVKLVELEELLKESDYISVHTPLTKDTKYILGEKAFNKIKKGARIISCARGGIVDEQALFKALQTGKVAGAALDVFEKEPPEVNPLLESDKIVATCHLGASTEEAQSNVAIEIAEQVKDALLGKGVRNAVNMPSIEPDVYNMIKPYVELAEKLGSLEAQLVRGHILQVVIKYSGDITDYSTSYVTIAFIKGLLAPVVGENVNYVNASVIARERGIKVIETKTAKKENFTNLITAEVKTDKEKRTAMATLFTKNNLKIVKIDDFYVEAIPSGYMVIISNKDTPGVIGAIGTILGNNSINIAGMTFGRRKAGGDAITVLNVDSFVSEKVLEEIEKNSDIWEAKLVKL